MNDQILSAIRSLCKYGAGILTAKGYTDNSTAEIVISGVLAAIGIVWSALHHAQNPTTPEPPVTPAAK